MTAKIGCCGFPVKREEYYKNFSVVEVQQTFYKPPKPSTAKKWRKEAPKDFEFTVKAFQIITHPPNSPTYRRLGYKPKNAGFFKPCKEVFEAWEITREIARILKAKVILFQTPKSFKDTEENIRNMKDFFSSVERNFIFAFEPRGWKDESVKAVCEELDLVHAVDPFVSKPVYGKIYYFRLHGHTRMYKHKYSEEELRWLASYVKSLDREVYVMFNNVYMFKDARTFRSILKTEPDI